MRERYKIIDLKGVKVLYDTKKQNYVKEGDIWTKELIEKIKELKQKNFVVGFLKEE